MAYSEADTKAIATVQMNINIKVLPDIEWLLPNFYIQKRIVKYWDNISAQIEQVKSAQQQKMQNLLDLESSILDQAFHGKL
jgi:restriction endonuclease S subunit